MNSKIYYVAKPPGIGPFSFWVPLFACLLLTSNTWAAFTTCTEADHGLSLAPGLCDTDPCSYATTSGTSVSETITVSGHSTANVQWEYITRCPPPGNTSTETRCRGMTVEIPAPAGTDTSPANPVNISGIATSGSDQSFQLRVAEELVSDDPDVPNEIRSCSRTYIMRVTADGGGWGDPHITTVDGVKYDFQSAGEFIALRGDGIEVQTRQTAVSKQNVSVPNAYTGIASCVSIYTAVALRVGPHRVTIQPNISGDPDPSGLQIRVDGVLTALGPEGIDLASCDCPSEEIQRSGRIQRAADEESIEILYTDGTRLVVTPAWWEGQQKWYLNVNIYDTTASEGIMGRIAEGGWLPALSDSSSVGPKATDIQERYVQLYETFADSWRVTDDNSLFDYAPGTSTATFTIDDWPRENASHCLLEGEPIAEPVDQAVAEEACSNVVDPDNREDCIFDVRETGHTGFADAYERSEQLIPGATRTTLTADKDESTPGTIVTFTAKVQRSVSTIGKVTAGRIQFVLDGSNVGDPVAFDNNGNATWSTSTLSVGNHEVEAHFLPSAFGEPFRASSGKLTHVVSRTGGNGEDGKNMWWLWFLILLLILIFLWLKKRFMSSKVSSRP